MAQEKAKVEEEGPAGAPDWMVTFSDCMTLLLTFFVLLLSFAGFGPEPFVGISSSFAENLASLGLSNLFEQDSLWRNDRVRTMEKVNEGTETRTLAEETGSNFMREKKPLDFQNLKVFTIESNRVFWGTGWYVSTGGQKILDALSVLLRSMPSRVVISENGPGGNRKLGLKRAWAVLEYMTKDKGLEKGMFSITASATTCQGGQTQRMLEVTFLDKSVYE